MRFNLKKFRQNHKLFQSDMSDLLGINQSTISRAEIQKGYIELTPQQLLVLIEKYGSEEVENYAVPEEVQINVSHNTNEGCGTQRNGYFALDNPTLDIIRQQSATLSQLATKQSEQTDRLLELLEKLTEKL